MLKEMIQKIMNDPQARLQFQNGQLELAGMKTWERNALMDIVQNENQDAAVRASRYWF